VGITAQPHDGRSRRLPYHKAVLGPLDDIYDMLKNNMMGL
jgi:hypothetical protein